MSIRPLNKDLQEVARDELFETESNIVEDLALIKEWINKSEHLNVLMDDQFLMAFIRGCKHRIQKVKEKIDMFCTLRTHTPEVFGGDPFDEKSIEFLKNGYYVKLPQTGGPRNPRIFYHRVKCVDVDRFNLQQIMKTIILAGDLLLMEDDQMVVCGIISIQDFADVEYDRFLKWAMSMPLKMAIKIFINESPLRIRQIHYVNVNRAIEMFFNNVIKMFLSEKMKSRIVMHSSIETLYDYVPKSLLPSDYGGESESFAELAEKHVKNVLSHREYYENLRKYCGVDEKKRIGRPKNPESLFGTDGSFRKLEID